MKTIVLGALVAMSFATLACGNPCEKLAKAVCDKAKDPKICDAQKARAKASGDADKEKCKAQLQNVDKYVEGLQKFQKMKEMFKDFGDGAMKKGAGALAPRPVPSGAPTAAPAAPAAPTTPPVPGAPAANPPAAPAPPK